MINTHLAQISNYLIYMAMAVYTIAMFAYAAEWALGGRYGLKDVAAVAVPKRATAGARATASGGVALLTRDDDDDDDDAVIELPTSTMAAGSLRAEQAGRMAVALTVLAFGLHVAGVVFRGVATGRAPWGNIYEFTTAGTAVGMGAYLLLVARAKARWLGLFVVTLVLTLLGLAVTVLYVNAEQLVPALHSYWLMIHVTAAVISSGGFLVGATATVLFLIRDAHEHGRLARFGEQLTRMPAADVLDRTAYRVFAFTFPIWTFTIIAGSIWAESAWGRYWGWDPTETWAFITWVVYAAYLHARATAGWKGRNAAIIGLIGFGCFLFNYFGVSIFINGLHSYAGV
jgi:cytochrome c-type biogenesis protein CcsB